VALRERTIAEGDTRRLSVPGSLAGPRVSVVIPALNEAKNLPHVFSRLPIGLHEVILVDGNSSDDTVEVVRAYYPDIEVVCQTGRGKGNALACGFAACTGDIIVMLDADGSTDAGEIPLFVGALLSGADFVKGARFLQGGGSADITRFRRFGNRCLAVLVNVLYGTQYTDLCYGYNAFWSRFLPVINVDCDGFEVETLMNVRIAKARLRVFEVPSYEASRIHGVGNLRAFRDGWRVLKTILAERFGRTGSRSQNCINWAPSELQWDGIEQRGRIERRSGANRRAIPRGPERRIAMGRRARDRAAVPHITATTIGSRGGRTEWTPSC
jgi:glycosyltransferase involved in cell wall biosynthesis